MFDIKDCPAPRCSRAQGWIPGLNPHLQSQDQSPPSTLPCLPLQPSPCRGSATEQRNRAEGQALFQTRGRAEKRLSSREPQWQWPSLTKGTRHSPLRFCGNFWSDLRTRRSGVQEHGRTRPEALDLLSQAATLALAARSRWLTGSAAAFAPSLPPCSRAQLTAQLAPTTLLLALSETSGKEQRSSRSCGSMRTSSVRVSRETPRFSSVSRKYEEEMELQHLQIPCFTACARGSTACALARLSVQARSS